MDLVPVDHDPFANAPPPAVPNGVTLQPVDHDPWAPYVNPETGRPEISVSKAPAEGVVAKSGRSIAQPSVAEQVAGFPQRAADMTIGALGPIGEAGMTVGDMLRTGHVDPRDIPQVAGGVMLGVAAPEAEEAAPLEAGAEAVAKGITAYHGSPYDFDKFDISKIGTGEGAQAYGHGLYFAENPEVSEGYKSKLSSPYNISTEELTRAAGIPIDAETGQYIRNAAANGNADPLTAALHIQTANPYLRDPGSLMTVGPTRQALADAITAARESGRGRTYQVSINADPEHFLDWDKPLSEQPNVYQKLLQLPEFHTQQAMLAGERLISAAKEQGVPPLLPIKLQSELRKGVDVPTALDNVRALSSDPKWQGHVDDLAKVIAGKNVTTQTVLPQDWIGQAIVKNTPGLNPENVSEKLRSVGIPGIKYLDQGSRGPPVQILSPKDTVHGQWLVKQMPNGQVYYRGADEAAARAAYESAPKPTSNYVVFDDKLIDIIKKYGLAGLIAGGASHFATQPVDHDPFAARSQ